MKSEEDEGQREGGEDVDKLALQRENDDLRTATSQNENIVMELSLSGRVQFVSKCWEDIVGTSIKKIVKRPISRVVVGDLEDRQMFDKATQVMEKEDMSYRVRFSVKTGKLRDSSLIPQSPPMNTDGDGDGDGAVGVSSTTPRDFHQRKGSENILSSSLPTDSSIGAAHKVTNKDEGGDTDEDEPPSDVGSTLSLSGDETDDTLELEGQGLLIRDRNGDPSHTMWILKPFIAPLSLEVDLPQELAQSLGFGGDVLVNYLEALSNTMVTEIDSIPPPPTELCRICDRHIPTWWFERHSNVCILEHQCESELQIAHESLVEQRSTIAALLTAMDNHRSYNSVFSEQPPASPPGSFSSSGGSTNTTSSSPQTPTIEYRGFQLPLPPPDSVASPPRSPAGKQLASQPPSSPLVKRALSQKISAANAAVSGGKKSPIRLMELLVELCDMALQINVPEIRHDNDDMQIHSPQSETRIHQVQGWSPSQVDDAGLAALCNDTETYAKRKVDAAIRLGNTIVYSEKIRKETEAAVQSVIEETVEKIIQQREEYYEETVGDIEDVQEEGYDEDDEDEEVERTKKAETPEATTSAVSAASKKPARHSRETSIFSDLYLRGDDLPKEMVSKPGPSKQPPPLSTSPSTVGFFRRHKDSAIEDSSSSSSLSEIKPRSVTPKSILTAGAATRFQNRLNSSAIESDSANEGDHPSEFDLNTTIPPRVRQRSSISGLNQPQTATSPRNTGSPLGGSKHLSHSPLTPFASPSLQPHEHIQHGERHHRRHSSTASDFSRAPVSPLLSSTVPSTKPPQPSIRDYEIITPISKGAFGSVYLSRKKLTGEYFAIKVLKKSDMVVKNQVMNVKAERAILMSQADSPFVAKLFYTFQSKDYLFLVMEYLNGGDCAALIKALGGLSESWTQKYVAEVVVGVEDLHSKGIVHRDLKPDNLLIDYQGHLKLTDFGLSRMGLIGRHTKIRAGSNSSQQGSPTTSNTGVTTTTSSGESPIVETPLALRTPSDILNSRMSTTGNVLHDPSISLVPGYFNLNRHSSSSAISPLTQPGQQPQQSQLQQQQQQPPQGSPSSSASIPTPPMVLFDPEDNTRKFVGTPDYLAPETINGVGQDERSDWWSLGCILFEFLFGYPPFHDSTPEKVFNNILAHEIQWPNEEKGGVSKEAINLIENLLCMDPDERLGTNGADEIKNHPFFSDIQDWDKLWTEKASFVPDVENPECTDYFDSRGAVMQEFPEEMAAELSTNPVTSHVMEEYDSSSAPKSGEYQSDSSETQAGSPGVRKSTKQQKFMPLHIPPHVRDSSRARRLSEPTQHDDFGSFSFKNLPVLEKANKELIFKLRSENIEQREGRSRGLSVSTSFKRGVSPNPSLTSVNSGQSSPRCYSAVVNNNSMSPVLTASTPVRNRIASTSTNASEENQNEPQTLLPRAIPLARKTSTGASSFTGSPDSSGSGPTIHRPKQRRRSGAAAIRRLSSKASSPELYEDFLLNHHRKQSTSFSRHDSVNVFDMSPCNSDDEDVKSSALQRVQKRRQLSQNLTSNKASLEPMYRTLDILVCDMNPVWRYSTEKMLVRLGNRVVSVANGPEAIRRATGDVKFDIMFIEYKLPKTSGADVARLIHNTINPNTATPIVAMTNFVREAQAEGGKDKKVFDGVLAKPPSPEKLVSHLEALCAWKQPTDTDTNTNDDN